MEIDVEVLDKILDVVIERQGEVIAENLAERLYEELGANFLEVNSVLAIGIDDLLKQKIKNNVLRAVDIELK